MFTNSADLYDVIYSFKDYASEAKALHALIQKHSSGAKTLLDVACGTGMHMAALSAYYEVDGLDLQPELLAFARERNPSATIYEADMREFQLDGTYDVVTCLFSSIGYVQTLRGLSQAIETMAKHLAAGGLLIVEPWFTPGPDFIDGHVGRVTAETDTMKIARINNTRVVGRLSVLNFGYLVGEADGVRHFAETHTMGLFTHEEQLDTFRENGLTVTHDAEGLTGRGLFIGRKL